MHNYFEEFGRNIRKSDTVIAQCAEWRHHQVCINYCKFYDFYPV